MDRYGAISYTNYKITIKNIRLHPAITSEKLEQLKVRMGLYLDINCGHSTDGVVKSVHEMNKTIFSFDSTQHGLFGQHIYSSKSPERMVEDIKKSYFWNIQRKNTSDYC